MRQALDIDDITAATLADILGYEVRMVATTKVGTGQTGASYRLVLDADQGPQTLLAKVAAGDLEARSRVKGGYSAEVGFYAELVDSVDIRTPRCYYSAISDDQLHFTLLLEDLAPRVAGVQADGCSVERARSAISNLAALHAPRWNDPALLDMSFLINTSSPAAAKFLGDLTISSTDMFVERFREELGSENAATLQKAATAICDWILMPQKHFSVLHGDYRLDNLMFGEAVDDVVALDWQTASVGSPARDLAYFLGTCLEVELRREAERELVTFYHQQLCERGIANYDFDQCFQDYRLGHLQAALITTIGCINATGERSAASDGMFLAMAKRGCAAIRDLDTLALI